MSLTDYKHARFESFVLWASPIVAVAIDVVVVWMW